MTDEAPGPWTVEVDARRCEGNGMCIATAPAHFRLVDGTSVPTTATADPSPELLEAAELCPVSAISLTDRLGNPIE